jgi:hypothetical protein
MNLLLTHSKGFSVRYFPAGEGERMGKKKSSQMNNILRFWFDSRFASVEPKTKDCRKS